MNNAVFNSLMPELPQRPSLKPMQAEQPRCFINGAHVLTGLRTERICCLVVLARCGVRDCEAAFLEDWRLRSWGRTPCDVSDSTQDNTLWLLLICPNVHRTQMLECLGDTCAYSPPSLAVLPISARHLQKHRCHPHVLSCPQT